VDKSKHTGEPAGEAGMNGKRIIRLLGAAFCTAFFLRMLLTSTSVEARSIQGGEVDRAEILDASVQISTSIFLKPAGESQTNSKTSGNKIIANGIGSLILDQGKTLLVTHNHWGEALQDASLVELRDADNGLLLRMFGFEFKEHTLFQDAGTMILEAPQELLASHPAAVGMTDSGNLRVPGKAGNAEMVKVGEMVQVTFRQGANRQQVGVLNAEVVAHDLFNSLAILQLRSLDGQPLMQGDSGGGVWFQGGLVANTWMTLVKGSAAEKPASAGAEGDSGPVFTEFSFAAILPR
jgi:hypothetical protein